MDCHFLLQGVFPTQGSNPALLHCRQTLSKFRLSGCVTPAPSCPAVLMPPACWYSRSGSCSGSLGDSPPLQLLPFCFRSQFTFPEHCILCLLCLSSSFLLSCSSLYIFRCFSFSTLAHVKAFTQAFLSPGRFLFYFSVSFYCFSFHIYAPLPSFKVLLVFFPWLLPHCALWGPFIVGFLVTKRT